ncbi:DHS-like NAD/FAD-binding domain-containing protein [Rhexocercosporidium sp. MPI-PUGE-AT-0058]|nr:DHS-like NAD/FAD-binding domain-containing protein [Rhexocercosporidium sp. MPI-PUGE-AT-0058]
MPTTRVGPDSDLKLQEVADVMGGSRKVVVVTGAGISTNCGIPDFRSENGLYSMIQAQYDAAIKNPPWEHSNIFDIDDRPKKKRKQWYYEVVAPDGKVVDVIDEEIAPLEASQPEPIATSQQPQTPKHSSRSRSSNTNTTTSNSRASTPSIQSSSGSSLSSCSSQTPEVPISFSQIALNSKSPSIADAPNGSTNSIAPSILPFDSRDSTEASSPVSSQEPSSQDTSFQDSSPNAYPSHSQNSSGAGRQSLPNLKGRDLFDSMVWQDAFTTSIFYMFVSSLRQKVKDVASTTESHKFLRVLRDGGRLVRNYSQNIDLLEEREGLCTDLAQGTGSKGRFTRRGGHGAGGPGVGGGGCESVTLHGSLERLRCSLCNTKSEWDEEGRIATTLAGSAPDCPTCQTQSNKRAGNGRRKLAVGRLRPDIVLYGEEHPHANLIAPLVTHDLALGPDVLLIMGTSLRVHGLKIMVKEFAKAVHSKGGKVVFVNNTKPSESTWGDVIDYWVQWDCDQWVLDLKDRREDLWLPPGSITEERRKSVGTAASANGPRKRPQCMRDDRQNGAYVTLKILDQLGTFKDEEGQTAKRTRYWIGPLRAPLPVKSEPAKNQYTMKFTKVSRLKHPTKQTTSKLAKRKSAPARIEEDTYPQNNQASIVSKYWETLRLLAPGLSPAPEYLRTPLAKFNGNTSSYLKPFAFNSSSNHLPNIGNASEWPLSKMNLVTHPPSGKSSIPIHTPKPDTRKPEVPRILHQYSTRASKRFSTADTIVVDSGVGSTALENSEKMAMDEAEDTIVVDETVATPTSDRIKRNCSIGAIVSSPEDGMTWHDAQEVL